MPTDAVIGALTAHRPLCLQCIADQVAMTVHETDEALAAIAKVLPLSVVPRTECRNCGTTTVTFCVGERPEA